MRELTAKQQRELAFHIEEIFKIERRVLRWRGGRGRRRVADFIFGPKEAEFLDIRVQQLLREIYEILDLFGYSVYEYESDYQRYLDSPEWISRRQAAIDRAAGNCERCGGHADVVHHRTYERLGDELPEDLEALCDDCHEKEHGRAA